MRLHFSYKLVLLASAIRVLFSWAINVITQQALHSKRNIAGFAIKALSDYLNVK